MEASESNLGFNILPEDIEHADCSSQGLDIQPSNEMT